jgi:hypothetical protein
MRDTDEIKVKRWTWKYIFGTLILIAVIISCVVFIGYWLGWNLRIWICTMREPHGINWTAFTAIRELAGERN